jgi:hypothetical protein
MAENDWAAITGGSALGAGSVARGVSNAFLEPPHSGTNDYVFGFRSLDASSGVAGYVCDLANFKPIGGGSDKGGSIRAAMKRYSAQDGFAPFMGLIPGTDPTAAGYFLGLTEGATSYKLALKKGNPASGLDATESTILRSSTASFTDSGDTAAAWFQVRLDVLVNPNGDVVLSVKQNDLASYDVDNPTWAAVTGMDDYIDDAVGILTGSAPIVNSFYVMYGHYTAASQGAVSLFDHIEVYRQTSP